MSIHPLPHVDHVGSLLRPAGLQEARNRYLGAQDADHNLGAHDNAALRAVEDQAVRDVVALQESCGLPLVTDGEFRRRSWWTDFAISLGPKVTYNGKTAVSFTNAGGERRPAPGVTLTERLKWKGSILSEPFKFLKSATQRIPKVTIPAPTIIHFLRNQEFVPEIYDNIAEFWDDLIAAYRAEIHALAEAGCKVLQIDECMIPLLCDPRHQKFSLLRGEDPKVLIETYIWLINEAIAGRPKDMTLLMHMCRGNMNAFWGGEGGYDPVAEAVFGRLDVDGYLLEYDTSRAGGFSPLRYFPKGKTAYLGIVSTKVRELETSDSLKKRIDEASNYLPLEQLGLCPQCGFSTNVFGTDFSIDDERRKLDLIVKVSQEIWN